MTTKLAQYANSDGTFAVEVAVIEGDLKIRARSWRGKWGSWKDSVTRISFPDDQSRHEIGDKLVNSDYDLSGVL